MILHIPWGMVYRITWIYLLLSFRMYLLFSYLIIIKSVKQNVWNSYTPILDPWGLQWILSVLHFQQMPYLFHRVNKIHTISSLFCHNILPSLNMYQAFSPFFQEKKNVLFFWDKLCSHNHPFFLQSGLSIALDIYISPLTIHYFPHILPWLWSKIRVACPLPWIFTYFFWLPTISHMHYHDYGPGYWPPSPRDNWINFLSSCTGFCHSPQIHSPVFFYSVLFEDSFDWYAVLVKILQLILIVLRMNLAYRKKPVHSGLSTFPALSVSSPCDTLWTLKVTSSYTLWSYAIS